MSARLLLTLMLVYPPVAFAALSPEPIDLEIAKIKPRPTDDLSAATQKCELLAREAQRRGVSTLLLGFEGQDGFSPDNAWLVYRYLWRITHQIADVPPVLNNSAPVLHRLLLPLIDHFGGRVEVLNFPETSVSEKSGGIPEACVAAWVARPDHPRVALLGHSFGADAAHDLSTLLGARGIRVDQAYSMDPITRSRTKSFRKPANVDRWINFLQRNNPPFGSVIVRADHNFDLSRQGVNHRTIVRSAPVSSNVTSGLDLLQP